MSGLGHKLVLALGVADLRRECARHVADTMGAEYVPEFDELYEKIGRGVPVSLVEAITVVEIVETVKKQLHEKNIWYRLKAWCSKPTE